MVYGLKVWKVIGVCTVHRFLDVVIAVYELCPCCPSRCDIENADVMFTVKEEAEDVDNADKQRVEYAYRPQHGSTLPWSIKKSKQKPPPCYKNMIYTEIEHMLIGMVK